MSNDALRALTYIEGLLAMADPELFECACKGGHASELLPVDLGELFVVSNALRAALAPVTDEEVERIRERHEAAPFETELDKLYEEENNV